MKTEYLCKHCWEKMDKEDWENQFNLCDECFNKKGFKKLQEENEEIKDSLDNCLPIDKAENEDIWERINELINNEIEQEKLCNI